MFSRKKSETRSATFFAQNLVTDVTHSLSRFQQVANPSMNFFCSKTGVRPGRTNGIWAYTGRDGTSRDMSRSQDISRCIFTISVLVLRCNVLVLMLRKMSWSWHWSSTSWSKFLFFFISAVSEYLTRSSSANSVFHGHQIRSDRIIV